MSLKGKSMKIISGGQTGVDRLGLNVAKDLGIETGGFCPKGFRTEKGNDETLKDFGLIETQSNGFMERTELNVINSDGTILFGDMSSSGSRMTIDFLKKHKKPYKINPNVNEVKDFIKDKNIINVAGNRGSKLNETQLKNYEKILKEGFGSD